MSDATVDLEGLPSRLLPQGTPDSAAPVGPSRWSSYRENYALNPVPSKQLLSDEGTYFVTTNPTPGTLIAYGSAGTQASFSDTVGFMVIKNNAAVTTGVARRVFLDYLRLCIGGTVPASATSTHFAIKIDTQSRLPTANFTLLSPVNPSFASQLTANAQVWVPNAQTITVPASSGSARLVGRGLLRSVISVVQDEYVLQFGAGDAPGGAVGSTAGRIVSHTAPVSLGPQEWCVIHLWQPSGATNPLSFEFELGHFER